MSSSYNRFSGGHRRWLRKAPQVLAALSPSLYVALPLSFALTLAPVAQAGLDGSGVSFRSLSLSDSKGETKLTHSSLKSTVALSSVGRKMSWRINLSHLRPTGFLQWGSASAKTLSDLPAGGRLSGRSFLEDEYVEVTGELEDRNKLLRTALSWKWRNEGRSDVSATVWLQPHRLFGISGKLALLRLLPAFSDIFYDFRSLEGALSRVGGRISWESPSTVNELRFRIDPVEGLSVGSQFTRANMRPKIPSQGGADPGTYVGVIDGKWSVTGVDLEYGAEDERHFAAGYKRVVVDTRLQAYDGGRKFAHFGEVNIITGLVSLKYQTPTWSIAANTGELKGDVAGTLEAWPFLNGLLSVIGERRHFVGEGRVTWRYVSLNRPIVKKSKVKLQTSLNYLHLSPEMRLSSWRPVFLGFGKGDLRESSLKLKSADLLQLSLGPTWSWNSLLLEVAISQWIPLSVRKLNQERSNSSGSDVSDSAPGAQPESGNGLGISLSLQAGF